MHTLALSSSLKMEYGHSRNRPWSIKVPNGFATRCLFFVLSRLETGIESVVRPRLGMREGAADGRDKNESYHAGGPRMLRSPMMAESWIICIPIRVGCDGKRLGVDVC